MGKDLKIVYLPLHGVFGLILVLIFWPFNWFSTGLRTHIGFFPLWLGYCLFVDAWTYRRAGTSLFYRKPVAYGGLFFASVPLWWLFELINKKTGNWFYLGEEQFGAIFFFLFSSLSFSTVLPAVFGTAELVSTFLGRGGLKFPLPLSRKLYRYLFIAGWFALLLICLWPRYFYPLVWVFLFLLLEPVNFWLGGRSLLDCLMKGEAGPIVSLSLGALICGFFWEFWNYLSYPKWVYCIPFFDFLHLFEMPLLGYLGYIPFSWELFSLYHFLLHLAGFRHLQDYLKLPPGKES